MNLITIADGRQVDIDSVPQSFAYNGDGTSISAWIKQ
jgi:hypothetical protein